MYECTLTGCTQLSRNSGQNPLASPAQITGGPRTVSIHDVLHSRYTNEHDQDMVVELD